MNDRSTIDGGTLAAGKLRRLAEQDAAARRLDVQPAAAADMPGDANRSVGSVELHGALTAHIAGENDLFCLQTRGVELAGFLHAVDLECLHLAAQTDRHVADDRLKGIFAVGPIELALIAFEYLHARRRFRFLGDDGDRLRPLAG